MYIMPYYQLNIAPYIDMLIVSKTVAIALILFDYLEIIALTLNTALFRLQSLPS